MIRLWTGIPHYNTKFCSQSPQVQEKQQHLAVLAQVNALVPLEIVGHEVDNALVKVIATQVRVA